MPRASEWLTGLCPRNCRLRHEESIGLPARTTRFHHVLSCGEVVVHPPSALMHKLPVLSLPFPGLRPFAQARALVQKFFTSLWDGADINDPLSTPCITTSMLSGLDPSNRFTPGTLQKCLGCLSVPATLSSKWVAGGREGL